MGSFRYEALNLKTRDKISGVIQAENEKAAREILRGDNLVPLQMKATKDSGASKGAGEKQGGALASWMANLASVGSKEKVAFCRNIALMVKAGIPLTDALLYFENFCKNQPFKKIVNQIRTDILAGSSFSQALGRHKKLFDDVFVNITKAGEVSGELDATLTRLNELLLRGEKIKKKIIGAMVYPCIVISIGFLVQLVMLLVVLPTFTKIYEQMGLELPMLTQIAVWMSDALRNYWFISFPLLGALIFGFIKFLTTPQGKKIMDALCLKIPVVKELTIFMNNSQFVSTFHLGFASGIPITDALYLATSTLTHGSIKAAFNNVNTQIQAGQRLGASLAATGLVPDLVLLMLSTGEESGELEKMLETSHEYLEEEINGRIEILMTFMEPLLLLALGAMVGFMALAIYMPMFGLYSHM